MPLNNADGGWVRPFAVVYALTVGLVVGVIILVVGTLYGIVGTVLRLIEFGEGPSYDTWTRRPITGPVRGTIRWWGGLLYYSVTGSGQFTLTPDMSG